MYYHTDNKFTLQTLAIAANNAAENGRSLRLDVDSEGRLKFKVGEGMWSAPIPSTPDPYRSGRAVGMAENVTLKPTGIKWFINEEGYVYPYPAEHQREDYPNDDHTPYDSEADAYAAAI